MLTLALGATLVGFVLLILGLITGTVWLAVACIVICLLGLAFLLVDVFSGRNRDSARSLEDMVPGAGRDEADADRDDAGSPGARGDDDESRTRRYSTSTQDSGAGEKTVAYEQPPFEPGMAAPSGPASSGPTPSRPDVPESRPAPERREGNLEDYLRSVGEPVGQPNSGPTPVPGQGPPGRTGPGQPPRAPYQAPGQQSPGGELPRPDGPRPPQYGSSQYGNPQAGPQQQYRQPSSGQPPAWPQGQDSARPDPAQSGERPQGEQPESPQPRPGRRRAPDFDPLDPNWRPPLD
ncbi:hypothetical protein [Gordonia sp. C13]|uniref:hypothetical protein n=1 Tax=Gordonia sp. C13 TaxID=2935078 RepID=UPI00200A5833|nr:hypothetical protein [Gordonia sp. C13]MCK8615042.1 hypothetical protein [Gordonia sp. C13]